MLIPFGILSAAGVSVVTTGTYELISTTVLGSAASSVTLSNLGDYSTTYKHLQLRVVSGHDQAGGNGLSMRINGDTGSNYSFHRISGDGSSVLSTGGSSQTSIDAIVFLRQTLSNLATGAAVIDILDAYSTTKNKTIRSLTGAASTNSLVGLASGQRINTASVTSVTLFPSAGNINSGSRFSIYGIRG